VRAEAHLYGRGWLLAEGQVEPYDSFSDLLVLELV
jgi:hypothetical protein